MSCPLCDKLASLPPEDVVFEFPHSVALLGPWQYHTGYCVLVSRRHVAELHHLTDAERTAFVDEACRLSRAIEAAFSPWKLNVESLGNVVPHLHWHIFPRRADDPDRLKAVWLAFDRADRDADEKRRLETGPWPRAEIIRRLQEKITRGSPLALWQAHFVADRLRSLHPGLVVELVEIQTTGDQVQGVPLASFGGEGVFTKAIQNALLERRVDIAVHSLKDLPTVVVPELSLAAVPPRGPAGDALVSTRHASFAALPQGAVVATSSLRRRAQLAHRRPDLKLVDIRGNVDTRLRKLDEQNLDATILAEAGLHRLGLMSRITEVLDNSWMLPAVGQGALGIECRAEDSRTLALLQPLGDPATRAAVLAERAMLRTLGGGCHLPIAARTAVAGETVTLTGVVLSPDGSRRISASGSGTRAEDVGIALAEDLMRQGAKELLTAK